MERLPTVLIVDDEASVLSHARQLLASAKMDILTAGSTGEALRLMGTTRVDAALIDWRLANNEDGLALGRILFRDRGVPFVLFSGYLDTEVVRHAFRQGAADVLEKPLRAEPLVSALEVAFSRQTPAYVPLSEPTGSESTIEHWAQIVLKAVRSTSDPKTEAAIAKAAAQSESVFRQTCVDCHVTGRDTRDLVRFLRAISLSMEDGSYVGSHLSIRDPRTRMRLFRRAGLRLDARNVDLKAFLMGQQSVPTTNECLRALSHRAANDPLFFAQLSK